jgi:hypothetical protein
MEQKLEETWPVYQRHVTAAGIRFFFLSKTDHCHQKACREFKINMTRKLWHYGLPSAVFRNASDETLLHTGVLISP